MKTYLVGGAVRDRLLGRAVHDRDWVVVGATPEELLAAGYKAVGRDFPVFLHPETGDEVALARTERKSGTGYRGFTVHADRNVTLAEDLQRRDLTINAIARSADGALIDPWGGRADIDERLLRHVSPAFAEDPVRILRIARFAARFHTLGFRIADETRELMRHMVKTGETDSLVPERVWQECSRALAEPSPDVFVSTLRDCGALSRVMPELDRLFGTPQVSRHHPEIDTGAHVLLALRNAASNGADAQTRFAVLCHDLGKGDTEASMLPAHHGHETRGGELTEQMCQRLRVPTAWRELAVLTARYHSHCHRAQALKTGTLLKVLSALDPTRREARFHAFLLACSSDARGRTGREQIPYPQAAFLKAAAARLRKVDAGAIAKTVDDKSAIPDAIRQAKLSALRAFKNEQPC